MIITTTQGIEGRSVSVYHGIVVGEAVMGVNIFKDLFASVRNIVGGRTGSYESELRKARDAAFDDLAAAARELGADAVVAVDMDYEVIGSGGSAMLLVSISGTAVSLR